MKETKAAIRYAKAVLDLAAETKVATEVNKDMQLIAATINETKDLQIALKSPVIKAESKKDTLVSIFKGSINNISKGLINQLYENKRLPILKEIAVQYSIMYDHFKGTQVAMVTSAVPLTDDLSDKILEKVKSIVGKKVTIENIIDPSIIDIK